MSSASSPTPTGRGTAEDGIDFDPEGMALSNALEEFVSLPLLVCEPHPIHLSVSHAVMASHPCLVLPHR